MFKYEEIKAGYILEIQEGHKTHLAMVCNTPSNKLCISGEDTWCYLHEYKNNNLKYNDKKIMKVYGYCGSNMDAHRIGTYKRDLLWERKELTIEERLQQVLDIKCASKECDHLTCEECRAEEIIKHFDIKEK